MCDRIAIIDHGVVIADGTPTDLKRQVGDDTITLDIMGAPDAVAEVLRHHQVGKGISVMGQQVRVRVAQGEVVLPDLLRLLDAQRIGLHGLALTHPTLNDVFLRLTGRSLHETTASSEERGTTR